MAHPWINNQFNPKASSTNVLLAMREWDSKRKFEQSNKLGGGLNSDDEDEYID